MFLAGLLYSSWPLGFWLNPRANRGLASNLEALHQPYNWVFIAFDVISGAIICVAAWWLLRFIRKHRKRWDNIWLEAAIMGVGIFGLLTALDAVLPLNCVEAEQHCLPPLEDPYFVIHGIASIGSIAGLTLSLVAIWWLLARDPRVLAATRWILHSLLFIWFCFGVSTAVLVARDRSSGLSEHVFILICSFWLAIVPYFVWQVLHLRPNFPLRVYASSGAKKSSRYRAGGSQTAKPKRKPQKHQLNTR